jgi:hypothetical protein
MADKNTLRSSLSNDPSWEANRMAELARVVARSGPFDDVGISNSRTIDGREETAATPQAAPDWRRSAPLSHTVRTQDVRVTPDFPPAGHQPAASDDVDERGYATEYLAHTDHLSHHNEPALAIVHHGHDKRYYNDRISTAPQDEEMSGHPRWAGRRLVGPLTALTLIGCAILSAGAYGYRNYYAGSAAPVIVADKTPTSVVYATGPQAGRVIPDRVDDLGPNRTQSAAEGGGTAALADNNSGSLAAPPAARPSGAGAAAPSSATSNEPKRVRTVTVRPDSNDPSGRPVDVTSSAGAVGPDAKSRGAITPPARETLLSAPAPGVTAAPISVGTGGYVVQVSAKRRHKRPSA